MKPNCSAVSTSRSAPTFAPSGANTELQESANELLSEPPHASPWAFWSFTPSSCVSVWTGKLAFALTLPASSAAASVMILNVEPGGWGAENAMPESPSTSPVAGRSTAMPPKRPASASTAARWMSGSIAVRTSTPSLRLRARHHAPAGAQDAARAAGQPRVELALEPVEPDRRALGHAALLELGGALGRRRADAAGDLGGQRAEVRQAVGALGQRRAVAREDVAALGQRRLARQLLAAAQAGEDELGAPVDRLAVHLVDHRQPDGAAQAAEDPRLHRDRQVVGAVLRLAAASARASLRSVIVSPASR